MNLLGYILSGLLAFSFSNVSFSAKNSVFNGDFHDHFIQTVNMRASHILSENINSDNLLIELENFHNETLERQPIDKSPSYQTPEKKLAGILVELAIWDNIWVQVGQMIGSQVVGEIALLHRSPIETLMLESRIRYEAASETSTIIGVTIKQQIEEQLENLINGQYWQPIGKLVKGLGGDLLKKELQRFELVTTKPTVSTNKEVLTSAITYLFTVYQLSSLSLRNSTEFKNILNNVSSFISENLTSDQAQNLLENLLMPASPDNSHLIKAQLELVKRYISSDI